MKINAEDFFRYDENYQIDNTSKNESSEIDRINEFFKKFYKK